MDLRGLNPEDVYQLMGSALNLRQIQGSEQNAANKLSSDEAKRMMDTYWKNRDFQLKQDAENRLQRGQEADLSRPRDVGTYTANGKVYMRSVDPTTNQIVTKDMGSAPAGKADIKLLRSPDGRIIRADMNDPNLQIPDGTTYLGTFGNQGLSINDQSTLAALKGIVETGEGGGQEYTDQERDAYMTMINSSDPNNQYVKIPGAEIPGMFNDRPAEYIKLPKQVKGFEALPDDQVVGWVDKDQKAITMAQVRETANRSGSTVADVLRYLELVK